MRDKIGRYRTGTAPVGLPRSSMNEPDRPRNPCPCPLSRSSWRQKWIQLDQVLEQILDQYKVLAQSRALTVDNQILTNSLLMDPAILKLVLSNNIIKHSDASGDPAPSRKKKGRGG